MAHELSTVSGKTEMFWIGEKPWHGLGEQFPELLTAETVRNLPAFKWQVEQVLLTMPGNLVVPDRVANIRWDRDGKMVYLGTVSNDYEIIQNDVFISFLDALKAEGKAKFETGGCIRDGKRLWFSIKLPGVMDLGKGDVTEKYLLGVNDHSGKMMARVFFAPIRVVCNNTLTSALNVGQGQGISIRHMGDVNSHLEEAQNILGLAVSYYEEIQRKYESMIRRRLTNTESEVYIGGLFPIPEGSTDIVSGRILEKRQAVQTLYREGRGADLHPETAWTAYNAVCEHADHARYANPVVNRKPNQTARFENILWGQGADLKQRAFERAVALVG